VKKRLTQLTSLLLLAVFLVTLLPVQFRAASDQQEAAEALNRLGLFGGVGTNKDGSVNFDLPGTANRQTAATMLVRILGKGGEAGRYSGPFTFTDVDNWARANVAYAQSQGLVNGYTPTTYGGKDPITAQQYLTMVLRALGYRDEGKNIDFTYADACKFADKIGLSDGRYTNQTKTFTRGDIALVSWWALNMNMKDSSESLYQRYFAHKSKIEILKNTAPGKKTSRSADGLSVIDYSNAADGYIMAKTTQPADSTLVVMIQCPTGETYKYFYTSYKGIYEAFPLTEGDGTYKVGLYKNTTGNKYATLCSATFQVELKDELSPYLRPSFFVDYHRYTDCVSMADLLCTGDKTELEKVRDTYTYVVEHFTYDYDKAETVQSGYHPDLDAVWRTKKGICFDYAATMVAMLRTQGVATKLIVGYAGTTYHAWINVFTQESGWIQAVIFFDGEHWKLMDPTFASTGHSSDAIMDYINNPDNYQAKYAY